MAHLSGTKREKATRIGALMILLGLCCLSLLARNPLIREGRITIAGVQLDYTADEQKIQAEYQAKKNYQALIAEHAGLIEKLLTSRAAPQEMIRLNLAAHAAHFRLVEIGLESDKTREGISREIAQAYPASVKNLLAMRGPAQPVQANSLWYLLMGQKLPGLLWALLVEAPLLAWTSTLVYATAIGKTVLISVGALSLPAAPFLMLGALAVFAGVHLLLEWRNARAAGQAYSWRRAWKSFGIRMLTLSPYALIASWASPWLAVAVIVDIVFDAMEIWPETRPAVLRVLQRGAAFLAGELSPWRRVVPAVSGKAQAGPVNYARPGWLQLFQQMDERFNRPLQKATALQTMLDWANRLGFSGIAFPLISAWENTLGYLRFHASFGLWNFLGRSSSAASWKIACWIRTGKVIFWLMRPGTTRCLRINGWIRKAGSGRSCGRPNGPIFGNSRKSC